MALQYLAGLSANLSTAGTMLSSSAAGNYPASNAGEGIPGKEWRASTAAADDWVGVNLGSALSPTWFSVHGHNGDSNLTAYKIQSATNATFTTGLTTVEDLGASVASPSFFHVESSSPTARQYWRILFEGTNGSALRVGEFVTGIPATLTRAQLVDWSFDEVRPQARFDGAVVPGVRAENLSDYVQRRLVLDFVALSYTERNELRDDLLGATENGAEPIVIIPDPDDEIAIHGRVPNRITWTRIPGRSGGYHRTSIAIDEDPFALELA